jgi:hypothetical protein
VPNQGKKNDDGNGYAKQPKQNSTTHELYSQSENALTELRDSLFPIAARRPPAALRARQRRSLAYSNGRGPDAAIRRLPFLEQSHREVFDRPQLGRTYALLDSGEHRLEWRASRYVVGVGLPAWIMAQRP